LKTSQVRAAGDWSALPLWNAFEPLGKMSLDTRNCQYTLSKDPFF